MKFYLLVGAVLLTACSQEQFDPKTTLRVNLKTEPPTLDWNVSSDTTSSEVLDNLMDGLTDYDFQSPTLKPMPKLAQAWTVSQRGTVYTFKIRPDVRWHDGGTLTAQQFVDSWKRLLDPKTGSTYSAFLFIVKNAKAFNEGKVTFDAVGVKALDALTLEVKLEHAAAFFPQLLAHSCTFPLRQDLVDKHGVQWTEAGKFVGLGPFTLETWKHDSLLVMKRFDGYYGAKAKVERVAAYMVLEDSSALALYETGKVDIMKDLPNLEMKRLKEKYPKEFVRAAMLGTYYVGFHVQKKPFDNPLVRRAISMAINREEIVRVLAGGQIPTGGMVPAGVLGYDTKMGVKYDPAEARRLLLQAGYKPGTLPRLSLIFNTNEGHQMIMENIQAQLKRNLLMNVTLDNQEWKVYLESLKSQRNIASEATNPVGGSMFRMGWIADYPDPDNFLNIFTSFSENNYTGWGNATFDALVKQGAAEQDQQKRVVIYNKAQKILTEEEVAIVPIYVYVQSMLIKERVKGYVVNPAQKMYLDTVSLN